MEHNGAWNPGLQGCRNNSRCPYWALAGAEQCAVSAFHTLSCILGKFEYHHYPHFTGAQTEALRVLQHLPAFTANEGPGRGPSGGAFRQPTAPEGAVFSSWAGLSVPTQGGVVTPRLSVRILLLFSSSSSSGHTPRFCPPGQPSTINHQADGLAAVGRFCLWRNFVPFGKEWLTFPSFWGSLTLPSPPGVCCVPSDFHVAAPRDTRPTSLSPTWL